MFKRFLPLFCLCFLSVAAHAQTPVEVVSSIKPLDSLVANLVDGTSITHGVIVDGIASPHDFSLKPSQREILEYARIIFFLDTNFETFLVKPLEGLPQTVVQAPLASLSRISLLPLRRAGMWEAQEEDEHATQDGKDYHLWTDPLHAIKLAGIMRDKLVEAFPEQKEKIKNNYNTLSQKLQALHQGISEQLKGRKIGNYLLLHDGYQYFERRYNVAPRGLISVEPEHPISAKRLAQLRQKSKMLGIQCIFREPQLDTKIIERIAQDDTVKREVIDALGVTYPSGKELYFSIEKGLARTIATCAKTEETIIP